MLCDDCSGPTVERGLAALENLFELKEQIPGLLSTSDKSAADGESKRGCRLRNPTSDAPPYAAWNTFWLPPLLAIAKQCVNASRDIRKRAIGYLARLLS